MMTKVRKSCPRSHRHRPLTDAELSVAAWVLGQPDDDVLRKNYFAWKCQWAASFNADPERRALATVAVIAE